MNTNIRRLRATVYADTGFVNIKSLRQNICYHQGYSCENFIQIYLMQKQTDAAKSLQDFANDVGARAVLITDGATLLQGSQSGRACQRDTSPQYQYSSNRTGDTTSE